MTQEKLEKVSVVPCPGGDGFRIVLSWMTGGSGRRAEMLPGMFEDADDAADRVRRDYGMEPEPGEPATDRRP